VLFGISFILRSSGLSIPEPIRRKRLRNAICLLTAAATIVRLEIALFLLPVVLSLVIQRKLSLSSALLYGIIGGVGSLGMFTP
jgi:alpha-1,6-mannosyltransferase